jgi:protoporphyrinogen oxidase
MTPNELAYSEASPRRIRQLSPGDHVAVVGGGPAGLTAAYLLAQRGYDVTVFEGDDILGGISQTAQYKGFRFDIGGHRFFTKIEPVEALWHEILEDEFISVPRLSRIHYQGKFFNYPLKPANALFGLGLFNSIGIILSYLWWHFRPYPVEENFEQWVTNRFGKRLYEIFFKTYTEKVWGIPCTEIRAEWAAQRIKGLSLARAIISAASINKRSTKIKTLINEFQYPRLGPGQMWETCADKIRAMGGRVLMEHYVEGIEIEDGEATAVRVRNAEGTERFACDHVISTMPLRTLARSLDPAPPAEVAEAAEGLRYRDFLVVALILDGEDLFPDNWIYVHTPGVKVGRIQNFNNWSQAMVPEPGKTCLGLEYFCFEGDGLWNASDEDLVARATRELAELGVAKGAPVEDGAVIRMPKAYPIYDGVYGACVDALRSHIDPIANLHTVGRNGMHKYNNADHSMLTAMMAIWNMEGAGHDLWAVNTDFEYHEEQRLDTGRSRAPVRPAPGGDEPADSEGARRAAPGNGSSDTAEPPSASGITAGADGAA